MTDRFELIDAEELPPGERLVTEVNGVSIGIFNIDGEFHALLNSCPHQHGPVCEGTVKPDVGGRFVGNGEFVEEYYTGRTVVNCPLHGWAFDIETGEHAGDSSISVPTYDVEVEDGTLYLKP